MHLLGISSPQHRILSIAIAPTAVWRSVRFVAFFSRIVKGRQRTGNWARATPPRECCGCRCVCTTPPGREGDFSKLDGRGKQSSPKEPPTIHRRSFCRALGHSDTEGREENEGKNPAGFRKLLASGKKSVPTAALIYVCIAVVPALVPRHHVPNDQNRVISVQARHGGRQDRALEFLIVSRYTSMTPDLRCAPGLTTKVSKSPRMELSGRAGGQEGEGGRVEGRGGGKEWGVGERGERKRERREPPTTKSKSVNIHEIDHDRNETHHLRKPSSSPCPPPTHTIRTDLKRGYRRPLPVHASARFA